MGRPSENHRSLQLDKRGGGGDVGCGCLREREGEVETLAQTLEGQEGVRREVASGHLTVGLLVAARWTLTLEATDQQVDAGSAVPADSWSAAARAG